MSMEEFVLVDPAECPSPNSGLTIGMGDDDRHPFERWQGTKNRQKSVICKMLERVTLNWWGYLKRSSTPTFSSVATSAVLGAVDGAALAVKRAVNPFKASPGINSTTAFNGFYLSGVVANNLWKVSGGRRSRWTAAKNIFDEVVAIGLGEGILVATSAALLPGICSVAFASGAFGAVAVNMWMMGLSIKRRKSCDWFDIPNDDVLDKAYGTLMVDRLEESCEVSRAYRALALKFHPDKFIARNTGASDKEKIGNLKTFLKITTAHKMIVMVREGDMKGYRKERRNFEIILEGEEEDKERNRIGRRMVSFIRSWWESNPLSFQRSIGTAGEIG